MVIPNTLNESKQQDLLDAARRLGMDLQLLWRPVAAAMAWLEHAEQSLLARVKTDQQELGPLLCLHLGIDSVEAVVLELVGRQAGHQRRVVPGRRRPDQRELLSAALLPAVEHALAGGMAQQRRQNLGYRWRWTWASGLLPRLISALSEREAAANHQLQKVREDWAAATRILSTGYQAMAGLPGFEDRRTQFDKPPTVLPDWLTARPAIRELDTNLQGVVVTGPLATTTARSGILGRYLLDTAELDEGTVLIEGVDLSPGVLARQATRYLQRLASDEPTYLDTLPRIGIASLVRGEPAWVPLLQEEEQWVEGGRPWQRVPDLAGFKVAANAGDDSPQLKIPLRHEEHPTVREVDVRIQRELDQMVPVRLRVTVTPAQGNARVQVVPEIEGALGRRPVYVDWQRMKDTDTEPDEFLKEIPRALPDLMPRFASLTRWRIALEAIDAVKAWSELDAGKLATIGTELNRSDQDFAQDPRTGSRYATAISSDGEPPLGQLPDRVAKLIEYLVHQLPYRREPLSDDNWSNQVVRTLGHTSTPHPVFQAYLKDALREQGTHVAGSLMQACGWCIRDAAGVRILAELMLLQARQADTGRPKLYWIRALGQILRFRADATAEIESSMGHELAAVLAHAFRQEREAGNGAHIFKNSAIAIVFLLRRRAFDDDFLPPDSNLATELKEEFATAYFCSDRYDPGSAEAEKMAERFPEIAARCQNRRNSLTVQGGVIDTQAALVQLIDYIDRRGQGYIRFGETGD